MNRIIQKQNKSVDFEALVKESNHNISLAVKLQIVEKLNETFTEKESRWYIANLYMYMNFHPTDDFPINLDNIFKMIGFANKGNAKRTLENNFKAGEDYKKLLLRTEKQVKADKDMGGAGLNEETIMLNIDTFKNLCMIVKTDKAREIRKYYIKLENIYNQIAKEQLTELEKKLIESKDDIQLSREKAIIEQFPVNTQCIYYGKIDNKSDIDELLIKGGSSNNLQERIKQHKKTYENFVLLAAFKVCNKVEFENDIKSHPALKYRLRKIIINEKNYTELFAYDNSFTIDNFNQVFKDIIKEKEFEDKFGVLKLQLQVKLKEEETKQKEEETKQLQLKLEILKLESKQNNKEIQQVEQVEVQQNNKEVQQVEQVQQLEVQQEIQQQVEETREKILKSYIKKKCIREFVSSEIEKLNFINWLSRHIVLECNVVLIWHELLIKYTGYKTSPIISTAYKEYFEEYITTTFPNLESKYKSIKPNKGINVSVRGWNHLKYV